MMTCRIAELFFLFSLLTIRGQCGLVGPQRSVEGNVGHDRILPCRLRPAENVAKRTVEWTRSHLDPKFVLIYRDGKIDTNAPVHPDFQHRTNLSEPELEKGDMSLHLKNLKLSDAGMFICTLVMDERSQSFVDVQLVVGSASEPQISVESYVPQLELKCEAKNLYPDPEIEWRNGEGQIIRHEDNNTNYQDEYFSISSRIRVDITSSHNFTCLVRRKGFRETRVKVFIVPKDVADLAKWYYWTKIIAWILTLLVLGMTLGILGPKILQHLLSGTGPAPGGDGGAHTDPPKREGKDGSDDSS